MLRLMLRIVYSACCLRINTNTIRTANENLKVLAIVDVFTQYVRAVLIEDEKADTISKVLLNEWIALFGPMQYLLTNGGTNLVGDVVHSLTAMMGVCRMKT